MQSVGSLMAHSRNKCKLTQAEASELLHITDRCLAGYERGEYQPPLEAIIAAAEAYNDKGLLLGVLSLNPVWKASLPKLDIESFSLAGAASNMGACLSDLMKYLPDILRISCDSKITKNEREIWRQIKKATLLFMQAAAETLAADVEFDRDLLKEIERERLEKQNEE